MKVLKVFLSLFVVPLLLGVAVGKFISHSIPGGIPLSIAVLLLLISLQIPDNKE